MMNHSDCDHPRTSSARAKCRRRQAGGSTPKRERATTKEVDFGRASGDVRTPSDPAMQCDVCGVERVALRGTDPLSGMILTVGERCSYMLRRSDDVEALP